MLNGQSVYEHWLQLYHRNVFNRMDYKDIRQARLQWIDWMIAYWEAMEKES
jgi:hypothetical protein